MRANSTSKFTENGDRYIKSVWYKEPFAVSLTMNLDTKYADFYLQYYLDRHITRDEHKLLNELVNTCKERAGKYKIETVHLKLAVSDGTPKHTKEVLERVIGIK